MIDLTTCVVNTIPGIFLLCLVFSFVLGFIFFFSLSWTSKREGYFVQSYFLASFWFVLFHEFSGVLL